LVSEFDSELIEEGDIVSENEIISDVDSVVDTDCDGDPVKDREIELLNDTFRVCVGTAVHVGVIAAECVADCTLTEKDTLTF